MQSDQVVSQLYFYISSAYQSLIYNLNNKTLLTLFEIFDAQFLNTDKMMLVAKRSKLNNFQLKMNATFLEQIIKWKEMVFYYKELGRKISDDNRIYLLIKILPLNYKMKLSNYLALTDPKS